MLEQLGNTHEECLMSNLFQALLEYIVNTLYKDLHCYLEGLNKIPSTERHHASVKFNTITIRTVYSCRHMHVP